MRRIIVDLSMLDTKEKIHDFFSAELNTLEWYGRNLDALYDELTSVSEPMELLCFCTETDLPMCAIGLLDVLCDAAEQNQNLTLKIEMTYQDC